MCMYGWPSALTQSLTCRKSPSSFAQESTVLPAAGTSLSSTTTTPAMKTQKAVKSDLQLLAWYGLHSLAREGGASKMFLYACTCVRASRQSQPDNHAALTLHTWPIVCTLRIPAGQTTACPRNTDSLDAAHRGDDRVVRLGWCVQATKK
jgi:hypothetical protein